MEISNIVKHYRIIESTQMFHDIYHRDSTTNFYLQIQNIYVKLLKETYWLHSEIFSSLVRGLS